MASLSAALDFTLDWEGGHSDHEDDPGGRTRFGIAEHAHPDAWEDGPPTLSDAHRIYREDYWGPLRCSDIEDQRVATYLFDTAVNQGQKRGATILQKSCRLLGENVAVDGQVGPETLGAVGRMEASRLLHVMVAYRTDHHRQLAESKRRFRTFIYGWLRRDYAILRWSPP